MTAFVVQGDGRTAHKNARFCRRYRNRIVIPPATVKAIVAQRGASVAILSRIVTDLSAEEKVAVVTKIFPSGKASIAAGIPPAAFACRAEARTHFNWHKKEEVDSMRKRNTTIAIRCTEEESRRIHELADKHGLKLNDFVMRCALGKKIVVANGIDEIVRQQKAVGRNLNQIATLANMDRLTAVNFQPLLDEHRKVTELIGQLLREVK